MEIKSVISKTCFTTKKKQALSACFFVYNVFLQPIIDNIS